MDISEQELLARAVAHQAKAPGGALDENAVRAIAAGADLVFGLYPDTSARGFNYTVIRGAEHLAHAKSVRWEVIPFADADAMDAACGELGDYDWL
jgi:hypothetical protein